MDSGETDEEVWGLEEREAALDEMRQWFFANFEDPAEMTPYISAEGGYVYVYGGPYDAEEKLYDKFEGTYPTDLIEELASELNGICPDWAPAGGYAAEEETGNEEIVHPFDPAKIKIVQKPLSVDSLLARMRHDEIDLSPDFQRRSGLWKAGEKSRLIESLLLRIPLPTFFFDATNEDRWLVVDGLQRLTTLRDFAIKQTLELEGLEFLTQLKGMKFDQLPRAHQRRIQETELSVCLIEAGTPEDVKFNIFKRINTGGLPLSYQEIRHALHQGRATKELAKWSQSSEFRSATCGAIRNERREAEELVLRALAFLLLPPQHYPKDKDLDTFLNDTMKRLNSLSETQWQEINSKFRTGLQISEAIFGKDAFRKRYKLKDSRKPISKALFEVWVVNLGNLDIYSLAKLVERADQVKEAFREKMQDVQFVNSISTGTGSATKVRYRFSQIQLLLEAVLHA